MGASGASRGVHDSTFATNRDSVYPQGSISGTIKDAEGKPITTKDVCVQAYQITSAGGWVYSQSAAADADGQYTITGLQSGSYKIGFADCAEFYPYASQYAASTRNDVAQYYSDTTEWESASLVVLSADGAQTGIDAQLEQATSISGSVYTSSDDSAPKQSECVYAERPTSGGFIGAPGPLGYGFAMQSASDGSYTTKYLAPSTEYVVEFSDCSYPKTYLTQYYNDVSTFEAATVLTPTVASPATGINAHLTVGGKLAGSVADADAHAITTSDVCVSASRIYEAGSPDLHPYDDYGYATTDTKGNYAIGGLSAGNYSVYFYDCGFYTSNRNDVAQYYSAKSRSSDATPVSVTLGAEHTGIDAALAPATSISGHVYGSLDTSRPLGSVCVQAYSASDLRQFPEALSFGYSATDGSYAVKHLAPGLEYKLYYYDCLSRGYTQQYYNDASTLADATALTPTLSEPITGIDAHLANTAPETEITGGPANGAATNATRASFSFASTVAASTFECQLDAGAFAPCTSPFATGTLSTGRHTFVVRAKANGTLDAQPPTVAWTVSPSAPTSTSQGSVQPGGTVSSDPGASPSSSEPLVAQATLPDAGTVTMTEEPATTPSENGYTVFGRQLDVAATQPDGTTPLSGTVASPIVLTFEVDGSAIPAGTDPATITVLRNGVPAPDCTGAAGTASPDPCVESRAQLAGGGEKLTVLTTHCSLWNLAAAPAGSGGGGPPGGGGGSGGGTGGGGNSATTGSGAAIGNGATTGNGGVQHYSVASTAATLLRVKITGPTASVLLRCNGASAGTCDVTLTLTVVETVRGSKVLAASAAKKTAKTAKKTVLVGTASTTIAGGKSKTVAISLNRTGKGLLAKLGTLRPKLVIDQSAAGQTKLVTGRAIAFSTTSKKRHR